MHKAVVQLFKGATTVTLEAPSPKELIQQLSFYSQLPQECPICSSGLAFSYRETQGYKFWSLVCSGEPQHESVFDQYKADGGLFYKAAWTVVQRGREEEEGPPPVPAPQKTAPLAQESTQVAAKGSELPGGLATVVQVNHLREVLKEAGLTVASEATARESSRVAEQQRRFLSTVLGAKVTLIKSLTEKQAHQILTYLGSYDKAGNYRPDRRKITAFVEHLEIVGSTAVDFSQLGKE
jgi:hypothetical protein